ncbi:MAG: putative transcriptional regulator [Lentisphaeria bacterium]
MDTSKQCRFRQKFLILTKGGKAMAVISKFSELEDISSLSVRDLMSTSLLTVYEGWSVKRLAGFFVKHDISAAPVVASDDELVGVVSQSDVVRFESKEPTDAQLERMVQFYCGPFGGSLSKQDLQHLKEKANDNCTVNSIMSTSVSSIDISASVAEACKAIVERDQHHLFITQGAKLVGVVSAKDILRKMLPVSVEG